MRKPRLFIASSVESLEIAEAINVNLDHDLEVTIWKNGTFELSSTSIDDLVKKSSSVDFALFIFTPDDLSLIRKQEKHVVRDNVLFELGLFIGAIGKDRSFIIKPRGVDLHLPTDLLGMNPVDYDINRSDGDLVSATNRACSLIKKEITNKGILNHIGSIPNIKVKANPESLTISENDLKFLSECIETYTNYPEGLGFNRICNNIKNISDSSLRISAIKLEKMGLIQKEILTDHDNRYDFYAYTITDDGVNLMLKHESYFNNQVSATELKSLLNDDLPF